MKDFFPLAILALFLSGCPSPGPGSKNYGLGYQASFVLDAKNSLHLFYANNYANKAWHLEKMAAGGGEWARELLDPVNDPDYQGLGSRPWPSFGHAGMEGERLCTSISYRSDGDFNAYVFYHACRREDGGWTFTRIHYNKGEGPISVTDEVVLRRVPSPDDKSDSFLLLNQATGVERQYLSPVDVTLFSPYRSEGVRLGFVHRSVIPFYNDGQWDGTSLIYCIPFLGDDNVTGPNILNIKRSDCYFLSYYNKEHNWQVEKIAEFLYEAQNSSIAWGGHEVNIIALEKNQGFFLIKMDLKTGKPITEPFPPSYLAIYNVLKHRGLAVDFRVDHNWEGANLIDREGKVHVLSVVMVKADKPPFAADLYYEVYNPDAADPTVPIVREFIEHQG